MACGLHCGPRMRWSLVLFAILCGACDSPCEPGHLPEAPDAGPGEARHGLSVVAPQLDVAATSGVVACLGCGFVFYFDDTLHEQRRVGVGVSGTSQLAVDHDLTYVLDIDYGQNPFFGDGTYRPPNFQLFALSGDGDELWRNDLGDGEAWTGQFAPLNDIGYIASVPTMIPVHIAASSFGAVVHGAPLASVFEPTRGELLWTIATDVDGTGVVAPDAPYGLFVAEPGQTASGVAQAVLRHLDGDGNPTWMVTWSTTLPPPLTQGGEIVFTNATRSADGGLLVTGYFTTATLDAGGQTLQGLDSSSGEDFVNFVAALDSHGATQWASTVGHKIGAEYVDDLKLAAVGDGAVICGEYGGGGDQLGLPLSGGSVGAFVAHVTANGVVSAYSIGGMGSKRCQAIAGAADGSAIVTVQTTSDVTGVNEIQVGSRTFTAVSPYEFFLLNIAL